MRGGCRTLRTVYVKQTQNKTKAVSKSRERVIEGERETRRERKIREGWEETI